MELIRCVLAYDANAHILTAAETRFSRAHLAKAQRGAYAGESYPPQPLSPVSCRNSTFK